MTAGAGFTAYRSKMESKAVSLGFDPTIIITLLTALLPLIMSGCTAKSMRRRIGNRARLTVAIARQCELDGTPLPFAECFKLADAQFDLADAASDEELTAFRDDCCN